MQQSAFHGKSTRYLETVLQHQIPHIHAHPKAIEACGFKEEAKGLGMQQSRWKKTNSPLHLSHWLHSSPLSTFVR